MAVKDENKIPELLNALQKEKEEILRKAGAFLEGAIKQTITEGRSEWPPLSPATIAKKKSSRPLVDTGKLRDSVTHKVEAEQNRVLVGVFGKEAIIAAVHEFGTNRAGRGHKVTIPQRSFLRSTFDEKKDEIERLIDAEVEKVIRRHTVR